MSDETRAYFNDSRNFGTLKIVTGRHQTIDKLQSLGMDLLADDPGPDSFVTCIRKKNSSNVCKVLTDQKIIAGIGNCIKSEVLWHAKIYPFALISDLSDADIVELYKSIREIMHIGFNAENQKNDYLSELFVYNKQVDKTGNSVIKNMTPDNKNTYWVEKNQTRGKK
ncbi:MAG: hypothetical protein H8E12_14355 [Rhodobacteraceae bacterium]|nr:hypothetical protein [Paracoccaceae bacterium]